MEWPHVKILMLIIYKRKNCILFFSKYNGDTGQGLFPDYNNQTLIDAMVTLIKALGRSLYSTFSLYLFRIILFQDKDTMVIIELGFGK